jgi:hypothetical protein
MRTFVKVLFAFFGLSSQLLGVLFVLDGFLPLRSHGPRFSPLEVALGLVLVLAGWYIRRCGASSSAPST